MASVFDGLSQICDEWLGIDATWPGSTLPRYQHKSVADRLCADGWHDLDGRNLVEGVYDRILKNWSGRPCRSRENWRFEKQRNLGDKNGRPEVPLERTITQIADENWVNQVPTASGVDDSGPHHLDLVHRCGTDLDLVELKVAANNPIYAAFEILQNGLVYAFSRTQAAKLGYDVSNLEILRANQVDLVVLAPMTYYVPECRNWLRGLEQSLHSGLEQFSGQLKHPPSSFRFEAFPDWFKWEAEKCREEFVQKDLLWALHRRRPLFGG